MVGALTQVLSLAEKNANSLVNQFNQIISRSEQFVEEMDFGFLYHKQRRVFHIGLNLSQVSLT